MAQILVVDDDPHVSRTLVELLALHGFDATRAESGEQGIDFLACQVFDLLLLDVRLPGMNGFATCQKLRERHGPSLPVIMLTAYGDAAAVRQGYEAGADDFLQKPVDTVALILKVRASLRIKSLHDQLLKSREEAQARARDLALLHEIGRDWSLIAEPEDFSRMATQRLAGLIGAEICGIALYEPGTRTMAAAPPVFGMGDELARRFRYVVQAHHRSLWNFKTGRAYVSNNPRSDPRLIQELVQLTDLNNIVLVPMVSEGQVLGVIAAANKSGGFVEGDVQLLSIFAGAAGAFLRSRQIFDGQRRYAARLERLSVLVGEMAAARGRQRLLEVAVSRIRKDLGFTRVAFHVPDEIGRAHV